MAVRRTAAPLLRDQLVEQSDNLVARLDGR
jgi:hypothetical protein